MITLGIGWLECRRADIKNQFLEVSAYSSEYDDTMFEFRYQKLAMDVEAVTVSWSFLGSVVGR